MKMNVCSCVPINLSPKKGVGSKVDNQMNLFRISDAEYSNS